MQIASSVICHYVLIPLVVSVPKWLHIVLLPCWRKQAWPQLAQCPSLTRLCLECLPPFLEDQALIEQLPVACQSLREVKFAYTYSQEQMLGKPLYIWVCVPLSQLPVVPGCRYRVAG